MTTDDKAKELFDKYNIETESTSSARRCSLIAVKEIIEAMNDADSDYLDGDILYWEEVQNKINKL